MDKLEVRVNKITPFRGRGSVHIELESGSLTISDILIQQDGEKLNIKMPMISIGDRRRPCVTIQGELKQQIIAALMEAYRKTTYMA